MECQKCVTNSDEHSSGNDVDAECPNKSPRVDHNIPVFHEKLQTLKMYIKIARIPLETIYIV